MSTRADVEALSTEERRLLSSWVAEQVLSPALTERALRRRRVALIIASSAAVFLVPWTVILSNTVPTTFTTHQWRTAWVGFDIALLSSFALTAWSAWRWRQLVAAASIVTATLLLCDAWFDLTTAWGSSDQWASILTAALGEIPFALAAFLLARRLLRQLAFYVWSLSGRPGAPPGLNHLPILMLPWRQPIPGPPPTRTPSAG